SSARSATILGPKVITGTKWPSMTSMWITRAPASSTSATCSRIRPKSADRIEGATSGIVGHCATAGTLPTLSPPPVNQRRLRAMTGNGMEVVRTIPRRLRRPAIDAHGEIQACGQRISLRCLVEALPVVVYVDAPGDQLASLWISSNVEQLLGYPLEL